MPESLVHSCSFKTSDWGIVTSFTVCGLTTDHVQTPMFRVLIMPNELNQLRSSRLT